MISGQSGLSRERNPHRLSQVSQHVTDHVTLAAKVWEAVAPPFAHAQLQLNAINHNNYYLKAKM